MQEHKEYVLNDKIITGSANLMFSGKSCAGAATVSNETVGYSR